MSSRPSSRASFATPSPTPNTPSERPSRHWMSSTRSSDKAAPCTVSVVKRLSLLHVRYEFVRLGRVSFSPPFGAMLGCFMMTTDPGLGFLTGVFVPYQGNGGLHLGDNGTPLKQSSITSTMTQRAAPVTCRA